MAGVDAAAERARWVAGERAASRRSAAASSSQTRRRGRPPRGLAPRAPAEWSPRGSRRSRRSTPLLAGVALRVVRLTTVTVGPGYVASSPRRKTLYATLAAVSSATTTAAGTTRCKRPPWTTARKPCRVDGRHPERDAVRAGEVGDLRQRRHRRLRVAEEEPRQALQREDAADELERHPRRRDEQQARNQPHRPVVRPGVERLAGRVIARRAGERALPRQEPARRG